jgi:hypothetical protein
MTIFIVVLQQTGTVAPRLLLIQTVTLVLAQRMLLHVIYLMLTVLFQVNVGNRQYKRQQVG